MTLWRAKTVRSPHDLHKNNETVARLGELRYSIPNVLVYHSKDVFQILWKKYPFQA